jgi:phosphoribosylformylglycinamidine cyclo-ligase
MDYFATGKLDPDVVVSVVEGVANACRDAGIALLGGETAEMPASMRMATMTWQVLSSALSIDRKFSMENPSDMATCSSAPFRRPSYQWVFSRPQVVLRSRGPASGLRVEELKMTVGEALLQPHLNYEPVLRKALAAGIVEGLAHITGGGITDNLDRILPQGCEAQIQFGSWPVHPLCAVMARIGNIDRMEMLRATNMGIGMIAVVRPSNVNAFVATLDTPHYTIGQSFRRTEGQLSRMKIRPRNRRIGILLSGRGSNFEAIAANVSEGKRGRRSLRSSAM